MTVRWQLREVMAKQRMKNKRLAELVGVHPNAISYLKNQDKMPRIGGDMLNALCTHLNCTPFDLIEYVVDRPDSDLERSPPKSPNSGGL